MKSVPASDSDEQLMARYARGEAAAFEVLYGRHELRIWRYLERNVRDRATADDLMQEVWFAVARDAARYKPTARFTTWLFTIAHNRMIDSIRSRRESMSLDAIGHEPVDPTAGPLAAVVAQEQAVALLRAVRSLPDEQRQAFLLQMEGGLSVEEIAAIAGSPFETVKSRLRYARDKLRELLEEPA